MRKEQHERHLKKQEEEKEKARRRLAEQHKSRASVGMKWTIKKKNPK